MIQAEQRKQKWNGSGSEEKIATPALTFLKNRNGPGLAIAGPVPSPGGVLPGNIHWH
jgi:hypothetical protein